MAEFMKLATFHKYGEHNIYDFSKAANIKLLDFKRNEFCYEWLDTAHIFAITEEKLGIQLIVKSNSFDGDTATYYSTLCDMCSKYCIADIYTFYPMFIMSSHDNKIYPCTIINVDMNKSCIEYDEYPTEIKINAEIPYPASKNILKTINSDILSLYYCLGLWIKHQSEKNSNLSEYRLKGYVIDV